MQVRAYPLILSIKHFCTDFLIKLLWKATAKQLTKSESKVDLISYATVVKVSPHTYDACISLFKFNIQSLGLG